MRVSHIRIRNVLGIEELEITPGDVTVIEALNGKGKTSVAEALRAVIDGGHDATLLRNGAKEGEVVIVLDDDTEIRKRITEGSSTLSVRRPEEGTIGAPKRYVESLFDSLSVNPVAFLYQSEKDQVRTVLEAAPLELDVDELFAAINDAIEIPDAVLDAHPLEVLAEVRRRLFDERTGVNRAAKEKRATVEQLSKSLPEDEGELPDPGNLEQDKDRLVEEFTKQERGIDAALESDLQQLREETQRRIEAIKAEAEAEAERLRAVAKENLAKVEAHYRPQLTELERQIAAAREREKGAIAAANTRKVVERLETEVSDLTERSQALTEAMARVDALKLGLTKKLPVKGLEIVDGVLHKDGVPFRRLNRAEQVKVAIRLAQLRAGQVPLVCVDGIECLDGPTFEAFTKHASKTGLQFVVTRVSPRVEDAPEGLAVATV